MKRFILASVISVALLSSHAFAGEVEGTINSVDVANYVMTLDDGQTYNLPQEFDITLIGEGMRVSLAYDEQGDTKVVTDMEQVD